MSILIENWSLVTRSPYSAPEEGFMLCGQVYNHPRFPEGKSVKTSLIVDKDGDILVTFSGSRYKLGKVDANYEREFPNARERLFASLNR